MLNKIRIHGQPPFRLAVIHGGPGAAGEMAPLARELAATCGVLEPMQTKTTLAGQIAELHDVLEKKGELPLNLIGFSWGAWLSFLFAVQYPGLVKKLILISSGPFAEGYAAAMQETRLSRLSAAERKEATILLGVLANPAPTGRLAAFDRFGELMTKADAYDPLPSTDDAIEYRPDIFSSVWPEAAQLRKSGKLLELGKQIECPVMAIHGDYDSHPAEGVRQPLSAVLQSFHFILLEKCGHRPWLERQARENFFRILRSELGG